MSQVPVLDDNTVCIGSWRFQVIGDTAFVEHAVHPGDIHIRALKDRFRVELLTDNGEDRVASAEATYVDLGPKMEV